ncbi:MAG: NAD(P)-dependent oxidoreductase [Ilumatobacteraceae bacterium]
MKIFVAGGTGVVGARAVKALVGDGHDVTVVVRSDAKADLVRSLDAVPVVVDLFDESAVAASVAGHEAVVNVATNIPPISKAMQSKAWATNHRLRRDASRHLVRAAIATGARRYVQESICFPYIDHADQWIDEEVPMDYDSVTKSSADAEVACAGFTTEGGEGVVLRFAEFYADDSAHTATFNSVARKRINPFIGAADSYVSFIHADDAAFAVLAALTVPAGIYNVGDDEPLTRKDAGEAVAEALGLKRVRTVPGMSRFAPSSARSIMRSQRVSNAKLRATGTWSPRHPSIRGFWPAEVTR